MRLNVSGALLLAPICFAQQAPTNCRTPLGVPCHTVHFRDSAWSYQQGLLDLLLDRYAFYTVEAVRSDGSFYLGADVLAHESPFGPATLYLAPGDELVRIFPHNRTFSSRGPLIWHDRPYRRSAENDSVCRTGILHFGNDFRQEGQRSIAGVPVFRWLRGNGQHGDEEIYLAPSLDCLALKFHNVRYNWFFIPVFIQDLEATSVVWGEPDSVFFAIPVGYRQVEDPGLPKLLQYLERQKQFSSNPALRTK